MTQSLLGLEPVSSPGPAACPAASPSVQPPPDLRALADPLDLLGLDRLEAPPPRRRVPATVGLRLVPPLAGREPGIISASGTRLKRGELIARLAESSIIYVGETHTEPAHHAAQLAVIRGLHERGQRVAVGLEMLPYADQPILDAYLKGELDEAAFRRHWMTRWSWYDLYAPILRYAKDQGLAVRGLNVPSAVVSKVAAGGLQALTPAERATLPETIHPIEDARYKKMVRDAIGGHGPVPEEILQRRILAQQVWNEVMGEQALKAVAEPGTHLVVVAGSGHMLFEAGIAESVRRQSGVRQTGVVPYPLDGPAGSEDELSCALLADPEARQLGSYFWLTPETR